MREVHRLIADSIFQSDHFDAMLQRLLERRLPPTGRKIAVAGSGPTGLTAAFYLAMLGHDVTVLEERSEAGGMLRFAIPEYRLPKAVLRRELDLIEGVGVKFVFNTRVGFDLPLNDLATNFDAVFISIGTWKESWLYLPGTELKNVFPALIFLESVARGEKLSRLPGRKNRHRLPRRHRGRRQCGHRFRAYRPAHGRSGHHPLSPRAQRHARHRRRDPGRGG